MRPASERRACRLLGGSSLLPLSGPPRRGGEGKGGIGNGVGAWRPSSAAASEDELWWPGGRRAVW